MTHPLVTDLQGVLGDTGVLTGPSDMAAYLTDWTGEFTGTALCVARPTSTKEVQQVVILCARHDIAITPQGGNTCVSGGSVPATDRTQIVLSLDRMRKIRALDTTARTATVEAGVILETLQTAARDEGLLFPLSFGARGSCTIGGVLATNAGGANVLRYGNARELCLGIEAVLADGRTLHTLTGLRKDNSGYDLRNLLIGSEGTLGIITAATLRLYPAPRAVATAFVALADMAAALPVLNRLQDLSGGQVDAFEYMPAGVVGAVCSHLGMAPPLETPAETGLLVELASTRAGDAETDADGRSHLDALLTDALAGLLSSGQITDAVVAQSNAQRQKLWQMREAVLETIVAHGPFYTFDASLPLAGVAPFLGALDPQAQSMGFRTMTVGHLGDGNLHFAVVAAPGKDWASLPLGALKTKVLEALSKLGGSFSAEHGIGQSKTDLMRHHKPEAALAAMADIKRALDPKAAFNPGKLLP